MARRLLIAAALLFAAAAAPSAWASTYKVTSPSDSGAGSLRQAILDANAHPGADTVKFNLPGPGVQTIAITTALPSVTDTLTINGRSQPGFAGTPLVRVDNAAAAKLNGLRIAAANSQILGLELTRFAIAVRLVGDANRVQGNLIGTNAMGDSGLGNGTGVRVESGTDNRIGGIASGAPNVISAGVNYGVEIVAPATATIVSGNRIGTNPAGTAALPNGTGVRIAGGSTQNVIGGTTTAERNAISGNKNYGVRLMDAGTAQNTISGNYVGTSADGAGALSDGVGIRADTGAAPNTIGGTTAGASNVVSGNASIGIQFDGAAMTANIIAGNYVGTTASGASRLANGTGIRLSNGANGNTIGGPTAAWRNVISGNKGNGVEFVNPGTKNNTLANNYVGVDVTGSARLGNAWGSSPYGASYAGVLVDYPAGPNTIGKPGAGNVISGNAFWGVELKSFYSVVAANYIGTDATGTRRISNAVGVEVDGQHAEHNTIGGTTPGARNVISGNSEAVQLFKSFFTTISGNYIGTDATGTVPLGNSEGVHIAISGVNTIGGTTAGERNVISGNSGDAVYMVNGWGHGVGANRVVGNYIGTDASGSVGMGNGGGVHIEAEPMGSEYAAVSSNTIGGNVISANSGWAVLFDDSIPEIRYAGDFANNSVWGNYIGTNAAGDTALPNGGGVKFVEGWYFYDNSIGNNVISGNTGWGVLLNADTTFENAWDPNATPGDISITGNYIGTKSGGNKALPNGSGGVRLEAGVQHARISSNKVAFNSGPGVSVDGTPNTHAFSAARDSILGNSMFNNTGLGIDLANGGNDHQAVPAITSVTTNGGSTTINGTLDSAPSATFRVELFSNPSCDPSGAGEGKFLFGSVDATTDGAGHATFSSSVPAVPAGQAVTATATSQANGDTSEFSTCFKSP